MRLCGAPTAVKLIVLAAGGLIPSVAVLAQDRQPVAQNQVERREETVYREEYVTEVRESEQTYFEPVTEYRWEPRVHGVLNPFRPKTLAYHLVPHTRWESRTHTVRTPVTVRQLRPETRTVEVQRRSLGFAQAPQAGAAAVGSTAQPRMAERHHALPSAAPQAPIGGVLQMEGDHPRYGWRPSVSGARY
ncbi:MAG: hypothetical protein KDA41_12450 [Planctomycetales bacterium]|nr:hypothetical protein [Planctomycetales bacterium]